MSEKLGRGRILYCRIGPRGNYKSRPVIVLGNAQRDAEGTFRVVGATTDFTEPLASNELLLPFLPYPQKHPYTKLCRETVAVCDWIIRIQESDIVDYGGWLPDRTYFQLRQKMVEWFGTDDPEATEQHLAE